MGKQCRPRSDCTSVRGAIKSRSSLCSSFLKLYCILKNIAKSEQSSHTPAVAIRGHTTLIGKREKWTNKMTDKQYVNLPYLMFVSNFKILGQVVPEKSLAEISIFIAKE